MATVDYFLKIDGIPGESQDDKHKNEIEVHGFSWGSVNSGSSAMGGGGGTGKVQVHDVVVSKYIDKSTPKLLEACSTGKHISNVTLSCRKAGGTQQEYLKIVLSDVLISGVEVQGGVSAQDTPISGLNYNASKSNTGNIAAMMDDEGALPIPVEQVSFNFGKIEHEYREQDSKGGMQGPVKSGWDVKANKVV
jgi:type VI secretion system secreted protein Hcp